MNDHSNSSESQTRPRKLRAACDICHETKVKCTGAPRCSECKRLNTECRFSPWRTGRPKGARNRNTVSRRADEEPQSAVSRPSVDASRSAPWTDGRDMVPADMEFGEMIATPWSLASTMGNDTHEQMHIDPKTSPIPVSLSSRSNSLSFPSGTPMADNSHGLPSRSSALSFDTLGSGMPSLVDAGLTATWRDLTSQQEYDAASILDESIAISPHQGYSPDGRYQDPQLMECTCLHSVTELLCQLKRMDAEQGAGIPIDRLLLVAEQVHTLVTQLLECAVCASKPDAEVALLAVVNIRVIVRRFGEQLASREASPGARGPASSVGSSSSSTPRIPLEQHSDMRASASSSGVSDVRVGEFPVKGADGQMLMDFVLMRTLSNSRVALGKLKSRCRMLEISHQVEQRDERSSVRGDAACLRGLIAQTEANIDSISRRLHRI